MTTTGAAPVSPSLSSSPGRSTKISLNYKSPLGQSLGSRTAGVYAFQSPCSLPTDQEGRHTDFRGETSFFFKPKSSTLKSKSQSRFFHLTNECVCLRTPQCKHGGQRTSEGGRLSFCLLDPGTELTATGLEAIILTR